MDSIMLNFFECMVISDLSWLYGHLHQSRISRENTWKQKPTVYVRYKHVPTHTMRFGSLKYILPSTFPHSRDLGLFHVVSKFEYPNPMV